jgi:hypothetical protein
LYYSSYKNKFSWITINLFLPRVSSDDGEEQGLTSIYRTCDAIEGLEEGLNALRYDDHNFKDYEVIYLVMPGNSICVNDYYYSLEEMAELLKETDR